MTPPNTPPSLEQLSLYENDTMGRSLGSHHRFLYGSADSVDATSGGGYPSVMYANNPNGSVAGMTRSRTNSSPAVRITPPSIIIPEEEPATFFFPHQPQQISAPPQSMSRARTYSTPITMQDYQVLRQQHDQMQQYQPPPQTLLVPANQAPPKVKLIVEYIYGTFLRSL